MWTRIAKDHWQNSSDKHLFYDSDAKLLCTEAYPTEPGLCMVVVPKKVLKELLEENGFTLVPEEEYKAVQQFLNSYSEVVEENWRVEELEQTIKARTAKINSLSKNLYYENVRLHETLSLAELLKKAVDREKENAKRIVAIGSREINALKAEVQRLKEKCGES